MTGERVLLVEDDAVLAELLTHHLERGGYEVECLSDGEEALWRAREKPFNLALLDWMVPNLSGLELCRQLRRDPGTASMAIIMVTARGEEEDRVRGLETGADDYIAKPFSPRELVARVGAVLRRARADAGGNTLRYGDIEMDLGRHKVARGGRAVLLGPTEYRLLRHFLRHPRQVLSREQLLDSVWGQDSDIEVRTVDVHIRRLRKALNVADGPDVIRTVRSAGYALDSDG